MILLIDSYDSFVHNLARYFVRLGHQTQVVRNDEISIDEVDALSPAAIVLSPGPCTPAEAGCSMEVVRELHEQYPMFGVCLGHQAIAAALGAAIVRAPEPVHGRTSEIYHDGRGVFADIANPLTVCRYHSLIVDEQTFPKELEITARTADGMVMAIAHRSLPVVGVQFHPEAILTHSGMKILANFLHLAGLPAVEHDGADAEFAPPTPPPIAPTMATPITF